MLIPGFFLLAFIRFSLTETLVVSINKTMAKDNICNGKVCHSTEEYCSVFTESCDKCSNICDKSSHNFEMDICTRECPDFFRYDTLQAEILSIQSQQKRILAVLTVLLVLFIVYFIYKVLCYIWQNPSYKQVLKKFRLRTTNSIENGQNVNKDISCSTIPNGTVFTELGCATSQIYSVTGAGGSYLTTTTPITTRYPAESTIASTEQLMRYSYENEALALSTTSETIRSTHVDTPTSTVGTQNASYT